MINYLYEIAQMHDIIVDDCQLPNNKSVAIDTDSFKAIGLDIQLDIFNKAVRLAHELGHCLYGGFYNRYSKCDIIEKAEFRANLWAIKIVLPYQKLREELKKGYTVYDIAEDIGVTEEFVMFAYNYYKNNLEVML